MVNGEMSKPVLPKTEGNSANSSRSVATSKSAVTPASTSVSMVAAHPVSTRARDLDEAFDLLPEIPNSEDIARTLEERRLAATVQPSTFGADEFRVPSSRRKFWLFAAPSWLVSLLFHVALLVALAAMQMDQVSKTLSLLTASSGDALAEALQDFDVSAPDLSAIKSDETLAMPTPMQQIVSVTDMTNLPIRDLSELKIDTTVGSIVEQVVPSSVLASTALSRMTTALNGRSNLMKDQLLERFGGNAASEKSVAMALKWLAEHQATNGGWTYAHSLICRGQCKEQGTMATATNAATAMALLPFLGAGQTHLEGQYKETVKRGLAFLIKSMDVTGGPVPNGSWYESGGSMYSHGLASITICEAYAMTRDPDLLQPAQLAINFIVYAQDPRGGGWRYKPKEPGDTSVVGWQLMALKSGAMGNLQVPQQTFRLANSFLDSVSTNQGAFYGYVRPTAKIEGRYATTAVGLLCRMYLGAPKNDPGLVEGIKFLSKRGPDLADLYYSYYATQVLRHHGGPEWDKWNNSMRDALVSSQVKEGHAAGSWLTHVQGRGGHADKGGRLYCTSLATMMLEVYYRHMPLYSDKSSADDFEL